MSTVTSEDSMQAPSQPAVDYVSLWMHHLDLLWSSFYHGTLVLIACFSGWYYVVLGSGKMGGLQLILGLLISLVGAFGLIGQALIIERMAENTEYFRKQAKLQCGDPHMHFGIPIRGWKMARFITYTYAVLLGVILSCITICLFWGARGLGVS